MLNPSQFARERALSAVAYGDGEDQKGVVSGEDAKRIFRAVKIRSWPLEEGVTEQRDWGFYSNPGGFGTSVRSIGPEDTLNTRQSHLHLPTLRKYLAGDVPDWDPDLYGAGEPAEDEIPDRYLPEVHESPKGSKWIEEGHHRTVAARLRGEPIDVWSGYLKDNPERELRRRGERRA